MSLLTDLNAIGNVTVGGSAAYPVISARCTDRIAGPDGQNTEAYRELAWELTCHAFAATPEDIGTLETTVRAELCRRGQAVVFEDMGVNRTMPAGGAASGSLVGYPKVDLASDPTKSFGALMTFTLSCATRIPNAGAELVEHDWERTEATDAEGNLAITQRGAVRTRNGVDARTYAQANFIDAEETAADGANQDFTVRWTLTADTTLARYELTRTDRDDGGDPDVSEAQVTDRTVQQLDGRRVRTISGYAVGPGAEAFADAQAPVTGPAEILVRTERTPATVPDGRVNFTYESLTGVADAQFPGLDAIFRFSETIEDVSGGKEAFGIPYLLSNPTLRRGRTQPFIYRQTTDIEFIGDWPADLAAAGVSGLMAADNLLRPPRYSISGGSFGLRRVRATFEYVFATVQSLPQPREIEGLE